MCLRPGVGGIGGGVHRAIKRIGHHLHNKWSNLNVIKVGKGPTFKEHLPCPRC